MSKQKRANDGLFLEGCVWRADGRKQAFKTLRSGVQRGRRKLGIKGESPKPEGGKSEVKWGV